MDFGLSWSEGLGISSPGVRRDSPMMMRGKIAGLACGGEGFGVLIKSPEGATLIMKAFKVF